MVAVPDYVSRNASRGLDLLEFAGSGLRPKTVREARSMARGSVTAEKVRRMAAWFARHRVDLNSEKARAYVNGDSERPTPGQVAWLLWGGGLGSDKEDAWRWAERIRDRLIDDGELSKVAGAAVRRGRAFQYAVPKPPGPTTWATGVVVEVFRSGEVSRAGDTREASRVDPAVLLQVYAVEEDGSLSETDRQVLRLASELRAAGDISDRINKEVSAQVRSRLEDLVEEHNAKYDSAAKRVTVRMLSAVFERGVGAYRNNPGSVRPNVRSAEQWAYARVNVFLQAVRTGRFPRTAFDTDLLPEGHPLSSRD
jgi:hypothetical protein